MQLGDICNREVVIARPEESLTEAARRMRRHHVGALVVVEPTPHGSRPIGMLTDRDIVVAVVAQAGDNLPRLSVGDVMTFDVATGREDEGVEHVLLRMRRDGVRRIPVVNAAGDLIGIIAMDDLLELVFEQLEQVIGIIGRERSVEERRRRSDEREPRHW